MTRFLILARKDSSPGWQESGQQEAHNAESAVRAAYLKSPNGEIVAMCAVPVRSWKPMPIRTETVTKVVLGESPANDTSPEAA